MDSDGTFSMDDVGKFYGIGRNTLFEMLRNKSILTLNNAPYQNFMNRKPPLFKRIATYHTENGKAVYTPVTRVYPAGVTFISKIIEEEKKNGKQNGRRLTDLHAQ
jgi:phage antirepressor YoqD-like protein